MTRSDRRAGLAAAVTLAALVAVALGLFAVTQDAGAATFVNACPDAPGPSDPGTITDDAIETRNLRIEAVAICAAETERLEAVVARMEALDDGAGTAAQRVALSSKDRERLDLTWYAAWASVGLLLVLLVSQKWYGAWRFLRE